MSDILSLLLAPDPSATSGVLSIVRIAAASLFTATFAILPAVLLIRCWRPSSPVFRVAIKFALLVTCLGIAYCLRAFSSGSTATIVSFIAALGAFVSLLRLVRLLPRMLTNSDQDLE